MRLIDNDWWTENSIHIEWLTVIRSERFILWKEILERLSIFTTFSSTQLDSTKHLWKKVPLSHTQNTLHFNYSARVISFAAWHGMASYDDGKNHKKLPLSNLNCLHLESLTDDFQKYADAIFSRLFLYSLILQRNKQKPYASQSEIECNSYCFIHWD